eukprot:9463602-Prorocentrum_lima.AAC.1
MPPVADWQGPTRRTLRARQTIHVRPPLRRGSAMPPGMPPLEPPADDIMQGRGGIPSGWHIR